MLRSYIRLLANTPKVNPLKLTNDKFSPIFERRTGSSKELYDKFVAVHAVDDVLPLVVIPHPTFQGVLGSEPLQLSDALHEIYKCSVETPSKTKRPVHFPSIEVTPYARTALGLKNEANRQEVTVAVWSYVKANRLQDPQNARKFRVDQTLRSALMVSPLISHLDIFSTSAHINNAFDPEALAAARAASEQKKLEKKAMKDAPKPEFSETN